MAKTAILKISGPDGHSQEFALSGSSYVVGREDGTVRPDRLAVRADPLLSRHHFNMRWDEETLLITRARGAKNPIFFQGAESVRFSVLPGQTFVSGKTRFSLLLTGETSSRLPTTEFTLSRRQFQDILRPNIPDCFRALVDMLPELRTCTDRAGAFRSALRVLKELVPEASEFSILSCSEELEVMCQELALGRQVSTPPSRRLVRRAFELSSTVTHVWAKADLEPSGPMMTAHSQADWVMASPIEVAEDERFALYVVGASRKALSEKEATLQKEYLDGLASLVDIVAETLGHHLAVARFNRIEGQVVRFFSPALRESLSGQEFEQVLRPKRKRVTVMFFDLRGFSQATEQAQDSLDSILYYHSVLTEVMTMVTNCVFAEGGVVVDYQGDAVMACWGTLSDGCEAEKAVRAAQAIVQKICAMDLPFGDGEECFLRCGLGIATGDVITGQVGAEEQTKFGVQGPVVNLASRLEGLTKYFRVPILIDDETRRELSCNVDCRRVGLVRPAGLKEACELYELVVPKEWGGSGLTPQEIESFELASYHYGTGEMEKAYEALLAGSRACDPIARFLARHILDYLDQGVPQDFDGVLGFQQK